MTVAEYGESKRTVQNRYIKRTEMNLNVKSTVRVRNNVIHFVSLTVVKKSHQTT